MESCSPRSRPSTGSSGWGARASPVNDSSSAASFHARNAAAVDGRCPPGDARHGGRWPTPSKDADQLRAIRARDGHAARVATQEEAAVGHERRVPPAASIQSRTLSPGGGRVHGRKAARLELARERLLGARLAVNQQHPAERPRPRTASAKSSRPFWSAWALKTRSAPPPRRAAGASRRRCGPGAALDEPAAERVLRLETRRSTTVFLGRRWCVRRWWSTRPASHMPLAAMMIDGPLLDVDGLGVLDVGDVVSPSKSNGESWPRRSARAASS